MLTPTPGDLLTGIHRELRDQVLSELPPGLASRQLRAALHALDLVARTWDLQRSFVEADNADLEAALEELTRITGLPRQPVDAATQPVAGVHDPTQAALTGRNLDLQSEVEEWAARWRAGGQSDPSVERALFELYARMIDRAALAAGVSDEH